MHIIDTRPYLKQLAQELERWPKPIEDQDIGPPHKTEWVREKLLSQVGSIETRIERLDQKRKQSRGQHEAE